jgi:hypothetical protein
VINYGETYSTIGGYLHQHGPGKTANRPGQSRCGNGRNHHRSQKVQASGPACVPRPRAPAGINPFPDCIPPRHRRPQWHSVTAPADGASDGTRRPHPARASGRHRTGTTAPGTTAPATTAPATTAPGNRRRAQRPRATGAGHNGAGQQAPGSGGGRQAPGSGAGRQAPGLRWMSRALMITACSAGRSGASASSERPRRPDHCRRSERPRRPAPPRARLRPTARQPPARQRPARQRPAGHPPASSSPPLSLRTPRARYATEDRNRSSSVAVGPVAGPRRVTDRAAAALARRTA